MCRNFIERKNNIKTLHKSNLSIEIHNVHINVWYVLWKILTKIFHLIRSFIFVIFPPIKLSYNMFVFQGANVHPIFLLHFLWDSFSCWPILFALFCKNIGNSKAKISLWTWNTYGFFKLRNQPISLILYNTQTILTICKVILFCVLLKNFGLCSQLC